VGKVVKMANIFVRELFLPARRCASVVLACLSVLHKWLSSNFLANMFPSTHAALCWKGIRVSPKIRALPSGTLPQTLDLENFATARRPSQVLST